MKRLRWLNSLLKLFGRKIVPIYVGHWYPRGDGGAVRVKFCLGYRLARREEYEGLPDDATELERFSYSHRDEIEDRKRHLRSNSRGEHMAALIARLGGLT